MNRRKKSHRGSLLLLLVIPIALHLSGCYRPRSLSDLPLSADGSRAEISVKRMPRTIKINSDVSIKVKIRNAGNSLWLSDGRFGGKYPISLAYHWLDEKGKVLVWDGLRTPLPYDLKPDDEVTLSSKVPFPSSQGKYILEFDMVQEGISWFSQRGSKSIKVNVKIE